MARGVGMLIVGFAICGCQAPDGTIRHPLLATLYNNLHQFDCSARPVRSIPKKADDGTEVGEAGTVADRTEGTSDPP